MNIRMNFTVSKIGVIALGCTHCISSKLKNSFQDLVSVLDQPEAILISIQSLNDCLDREDRELGSRYSFVNICLLILCGTTCFCG